MTINTQRLDSELKAAGIAFSGCNSNGVVWDTDGVTEIQSQKNVKAVIAKHNPDDRWDKVRAQRNALLSASDWTQMPDAASKNKAAWATYRQSLRDIPQNNTDPDAIVWPVKP